MTTGPLPPALRQTWPAVLGAAPVLAAIAACQLSGLEPQSLDAITLAETRRGADLAELPGRGGDAPLLNGAPLLPMDEARARNAAVPFYTGRIEPAARFRFTGSPVDLSRATECLALAAMAEAGPSDPGQRAVIQVVLNRVRHPAWPKSVCGVVYQGAERTDLLCQFTFSCDGAMARPPVADKWARARRVAEIALSGRVFAPVGVATFYHTLAVRPEWSSRLDPVAVVGAHIFYQMRGANGRPTAFRMPYSGRELIAGPPPRVWKPISPGALPVAMPYMPEVEQAIGPAPSPGLPVMPGQMPHVHAGAAAQPGPGWTEPAQPTPDLPGQTLPQSTIRPEYRDSGRPLI